MKQKFWIGYIKDKLVAQGWTLIYSGGTPETNTEVRILESPVDHNSARYYLRLAYGAYDNPFGTPVFSNMYVGIGSGYDIGTGRLSGSYVHKPVNKYYDDGESCLNCLIRILTNGVIFSQYGSNGFEVVFVGYPESSDIFGEDPTLVGIDNGVNACTLYVFGGTDKWIDLGASPSQMKCGARINGYNCYAGTGVGSCYDTARRKFIEYVAILGGKKTYWNLYFTKYSAFYGSVAFYYHYNYWARVSDIFGVPKPIYPTGQQVKNPITGDTFRYVLVSGIDEQNLQRVAFRGLFIKENL